MEYSKFDTPVFHDEPSFAMINRNLPVPKYTKQVEENILEIDTEFLHLVYVFWISPFNLFSSYDKNVGVVTDPAALNITLKADQKTQWYYGRTLISLLMT